MINAKTNKAISQVRHGLVVAMTFGLFAIAPAEAAFVNYQNFNDLSAFQLNGATASINTGGVGVIGPNAGDERVLRLTNYYGQAGSAFLTNTFSLAADASFSSYFEFQFTHQSSGGADGIVFTLQNVSNTAGGGGGGIGYQGLNPSIGIEFDNWNNGSYDGNNGNHAGININGNIASVVRQDNLPDVLDSGAIFHSWVDYNGATDLLEVRLGLSDDRSLSQLLMSYNVDIAATLGTTNAYVGFTSGTGGAMAYHDIRRWVMDGQYSPIQDTNNPNAVPEPASLALLGLGLAGLGFGRRKRQA